MTKTKTLLVLLLVSLATFNALAVWEKDLAQQRPDPAWDARFKECNDPAKPDASPCDWERGV